MLSAENRAVLEEVLSEDRDLNSALPSESVIRELAQLEQVNPQSFGQLFATRKFEESMFGPGLFDMDFEHMAPRTLGFFIEFMAEATSLRYGQDMHPYDALLRVFEEMNVADADQRVNQLLLDASDCELFAGLFYYCPIGR